MAYCDSGIPTFCRRSSLVCCHHVYFEAVLVVLQSFGDQDLSLTCGCGHFVEVNVLRKG